MANSCYAIRLCSSSHFSKASAITRILPISLSLTLIARERRIIDLATEAHDDTTVSLMNDFLVGQEKTVWMLVAVSSQSCAE